MRQFQKTIGTICLLALFVAYQVSMIALTHVHYVNGVLITHTHPFHKAHSHTKAELVVIGFSSFQSPEVEIHSDLCPVLMLLAVLDAVKVTPLIKGQTEQVISLRAPPFSFC